MEATLLDNLRRNQAFDAALKKGRSIDDLIAAVALSILMERDPESRAQLIVKLQARLVRQFKVEYQPSAHAIAQQNVSRVLAKMPSPVSTVDIRAARQAAVSASLRDRTRVEIVEAAIDDRGNTLANRLKTYYLEPGPSPATKTQQLVEQYRQQEAKRREFDKADEDFREGRIESRPRRPQLEYVSKFTEDVKSDVRQQARRAGTDAETAGFAKAGYTELAWVAVNSLDACKPCQDRHGMKGSLQFWDHFGRPGTGHTPCGQHCMCMLIPAVALANFPSLKNGLRVA